MVDPVNGNASTVRVTQVSGATTQSIEVKQSASNTGTSSSITYRKQWSCTKALKNTLYRFYNWLCKWIPFLPKRQQTVPVNQSGSNNNQQPYPRTERRNGMVFVIPDPNSTWEPPTEEEIAQKTTDEIARIENLQEYKDNPIEYVKRWIARRGGTEEYRIPEDGALSHFKRQTHVQESAIVKSLAEQVEEAALEHFRKLHHL